MAEVSYIGLLRSNKAYRRLFTANEISYIGDWFSMDIQLLHVGVHFGRSGYDEGGDLALLSFE